MSDTQQSQPPRLDSRRVPLEREVVLEFEHFSSFISEYSANISLGGMFVRTDQPHLPDTVFRFEIRLADDAPLISGLAKVLWVREVEEGADRPRGMGVRFLQLEEQGQSLIEQIVQEHVTRGGRPFSLEQAAEAAREAPASQTAPTPAPPPADPKPAASTMAPTPAPPATDPKPVTSPSVPLDRSTVIELPALEDLLEEARTPTSTLSLDTPPRGWKPGIRVAQPRTRPQLIGAIALAAAVLGALIYVGVRLFSSAPVVDSAETEPVELPQASLPAEEAVLPRYTAVEEITWRRAGNGAEIVVRLDGSLPEGAWSVDRISDPPRHLLRLSGASRPYPTETFEVGFGGVRQLRTGYHDTGAGNEQHVVVDLMDPRVVLDEAVAEGSTVRLRFRRLS